MLVKVIYQKILVKVGVFINRKGEILKPEDKFGGTHGLLFLNFESKYIYVRVRAIHVNHLKIFIKIK